MRRRSRAGVTLMELLIAVTLVGLLTVGILFAMRVGLGALEAVDRKFGAGRRVLGAQRVLDQQIAGLIPVQIQCKGPKDIPALFFQGQPDAMRFVSSYTLEEGARGYPRVVEYLVAPGERGVGVRLLMNEYLYTGPSSIVPLCLGTTMDQRTRTMSVLLRPVTLGPRPFVIADKLRGCRFSYLLSDGKLGRRQWSGTFAGSFPPLAIRIEMAQLTPDPSRMQMASVTLPVRVNRNAMGYYFDIDPPQPTQ